jgi:hypothetical protein
MAMEKKAFFPFWNNEIKGQTRTHKNPGVPGVSGKPPTHSVVWKTTE